MRSLFLWRQRGLSPGGERFAARVLALYTVRDGRLARAQMFYFDTSELVGFLRWASGRLTWCRPAAHEQRALLDEPPAQ
jgi:hypothetical protein